MLQRIRLFSQRPPPPRGATISGLAGRVHGAAGWVCSRGKTGDTGVGTEVMRGSQRFEDKLGLEELVGI